MHGVISRPGGGTSKGTHQTDLDEESYTEYSATQMSELDERGWAPIHHAAHRGIIQTVEKCVRTNKQLLEVRTGDNINSTPVLVATTTGNLNTVIALVDLGARLDSVDARGHGIVELCAFRHYMHVLDYFVRLNHDRLSVWKRLVKLMRSDFEEDAEVAVWCLHELTRVPADDAEKDQISNSKMMSPYGDDEMEEEEDMTVPDERHLCAAINGEWRQAYDSGIVPGITHVLRSLAQDSVKHLAFQTLFNLISQQEVREQAANNGIVQVLSKLLTSKNHELVGMSARCLLLLGDAKSFPDEALRHGVYQSLVDATRNERGKPDVLTDIIETMGSIVTGQTMMQSGFGLASGSFVAIVELLDGQPTRRLVVALCMTISRLAQHHVDNQNSFVAAGVLSRLMASTRERYLNVQLAAVEAVRSLVDGNIHTGNIVIQDGLLEPLFKVRCWNHSLR